MRTTTDLLNEVIEMGVDREEALSGIDACLDEEFGYENREDVAMKDEKLDDKLYNDILSGFEDEIGDKLYNARQEEIEEEEYEEEE